MSGAIQGRAAIGDRDALAAFIGEEAEAFARGTVDNYTRVRVKVEPETLADTVLARPGLADLLATARAEAFPIALIVVTQAVASAFAVKAADRAAPLAGVTALAAEVFDRKPAPTAIAPAAWAAARGEIVRGLRDLARRPVKPTNEIADPFVAPMLALMPMHDALGPDDFPRLRSAMRNSLAAVHARFIASVDAPALAHTLAQ